MHLQVLISCTFNFFVWENTLEFKLIKRSQPLLLQMVSNSDFQSKKKKKGPSVAAINIFPQSLLLTFADP